MSLIISLGSNLGDRLQNLLLAKGELINIFQLLDSSRVYLSSPVDDEDQPFFYNQILEFKSPPSEVTADNLIDIVQKIESKLGRIRDASRPKGPRTIDIDIIFWGMLNIKTPKITLPHPRWEERTFIIAPLCEVPFARVLQKEGLLPAVCPPKNIALPLALSLAHEQNLGIDF